MDRIAAGSSAQPVPALCAGVRPAFLAMNGLVRLIHRLVEPALIPVRRLLYSRMPRQWMVLDWSPAALWLLISIVQSLIRGLFL